ncbi:MAG: IPT/TIG domain-containing protein, partial [Thermoleophilia bacterium]
GSGTGTSVVVSNPGTTTISYHSTDVLGNLETPDKTATVNIDKTNPVLGATTPSGWLASNSPSTVTVAVTETGAGLNPSATILQVDGVSPPTCNVSNTQIDCNISSMAPLSQGNHVITVSTIDMAGNPGSGGGSFNVDTIAPFVSNNLPTGTSGNTSPTISADFTDGTGSGINLSTVQVLVNGTPEIIGAGGCTVTASSVSCPKTGLADNTYNVTVNVTDNLGFTGSLGWSFIVNTAAPTIDSLVPAIGAWTYDNTPVVTVNYHATGTIDSATLTIDNTPCAGAVWDQTHITCTAPVLTDGPHTIRGNIGVGPNITPVNPSNGTFSVDSTQPVLTNKTPSGWIQTAGTIEADITETGSGIDGASSSISVDGTPILNANCTWTDTHVSCTAPALPAGNHWTSYVVYDNVGLNNGFANSLAGFDVDLSAPTVSGITPAGITGSASPTIEFDVSDGAGSGNNASLTVVNIVHGSPTISETLSCTNVVDHFSCPASGLLETEYNVMIDVTDNVGNHRAYGNPAQFTVDASGPVIANFTPTGWINSATPTIGFDITDTGSGVNLASLSTTLPGSAVCSNSPITNGYHFSCPATGLTTGQYGATISVNDNLGNSSSASGSVLFSVDLDTPAITNLLPSGDVTSNSVTISADLNDPLASGIKSDINSASAAIHLDGSGTALTGCTKTAAQISCPATIGVGAHTFSVSVEDNAGNSTTNISGAFTLTQQNYYFPWYDNNAGNGMNGDWIMINNEGIAAADVYIYVGDISDGATPAGHVNIAAGGHTEWQSPTSRTTGPVRVKSDGSPLQVSQRVIYKDSLNEVRAVSQSEIDSEYFYTWYDRTSPDMRGDWVLVANVGASATADVYIEIAGVDMINPATGTTKFSIPAGTVITPQFIGTTSGMVHVTCTSCTSDAKIITSQRVLYKDSFNEVNGIPNNKLDSEAWFTWYDNNNLRGFNHDWVMVVNNGSITTNVQIFLGDSVTAAADVAVPAGGSLHWQSFLPRTTGPVHVVSSNGQPLIVSQRVLYKNSFNEVQGAYATDLGTGARFNWYDNLTPGIVGDWILVGSAGTGTDMNIQIGALAAGTPNIASKTTVPSIFPMAGGPVEVACSGCGGSDKFVISQRVLYKDSFDELLGKPTS